jgi:hypothetical protein
VEAVEARGVEDPARLGLLAQPRRADGDQPVGELRAPAARIDHQVAWAGLAGGVRRAQRHPGHARGTRCSVGLGHQPFDVDPVAELDQARLEDVPAQHPLERDAAAREQDDVVVLRLELRRVEVLQCLLAERELLGAGVQELAQQLRLVVPDQVVHAPEEGV